MSRHIFNPVILREYDIRGEVGKTLFEADALALGKKFGSMLYQLQKRSVCIGRDGRLTSPALTSQLVEGLLSTGMDVTDLGIGPTPLIYYGLKTLNFDAAIMVTGSHNPAPDNGFKIALQNRPFFGKDIQELAAIDDSQTLGTQGNFHAQNIITNYVQRLLYDYEAPLSGSPSLKIVWDTGNGATGDVVRLLVQHLAGYHILLNETIDGTFPAHHPDPTVPQNLIQLIEKVQENEADMGIAFDGDGDRIGIVDEKGRILWGDQLLLFLAREVVQNNPAATIIADVKSSQVLFDDIKQLGGNILMSRTGHSLIKAKIIETGALLAGEMSGHIFFADKYYGYDDALYCAVRFLNILQKEGKSLSQMIDGLPKVYNTPEIRINCPDELKFKIIDKIAHQLVAENATVSMVDGLRVSRGKGWWLLRASNTQPALVARCEASTPQDLEDLEKEMTSYLNPHGVIFKK